MEQAILLIRELSPLMLIIISLSVYKKSFKTSIVLASFAFIMFILFNCITIINSYIIFISGVMSNTFFAFLSSVLIKAFILLLNLIFLCIKKIKLCKGTIILFMILLFITNLNSIMTIWVYLTA